MTDVRAYHASRAIPFPGARIPRCDGGGNPAPRLPEFAPVIQMHRDPLQEAELRATTYLLALSVTLSPIPAQTLAADQLELHNVKAEQVTWRGRSAIRITDAASGGDDASRIAIVRGTTSQDGDLEIALTGDTAPSAPQNLRGFVGLAFRVAGSGSQYECIYLRPKNGRSEDQLQRNHSVQYISVPGFPWEMLRSQHPGQYESYVDLVPGEWTKVKISVSGSKARLYVNAVEQPVLLVNDLKQKPLEGGIALWVGPGTIAHFADLKVSRR